MEDVQGLKDANEKLKGEVNKWKAAVAHITQREARAAELLAFARNETDVRSHA